MKATIKVIKSFDDEKTYSKEWEVGDFKEFLEVEGKYLDRLATKLEKEGTSGQYFEVVYAVTVEK